ncbi:hypothetical protein QUA81_18595 [Microcoleus sp. F6_B4]
MPATKATIQVLEDIDAAGKKPCEPLPDRSKMSRHYRSTKERLGPKDKNLLIREAKEKGIYAFTKSFGDWDSGVTYKRLLVHYERGGQFPPTRSELNDLMLEF